MDTLQAFIQFFVDLFTALSTLLTGEGGAFDISGLIGNLTGEGESAAQG